MFLVPPINTKGVFKFSEPYSSKLKTQQEYTVSAIRSLVDLENSEEKPYDTIYNAVGMTELEFKNDLDLNVPIIVLVSNGSEYVYVPANRILSMPEITGIKYQEKVIAISLGSMPLKYNYDTIKSIIKDNVYDTVGINSTVEMVDTSAVILRTKEDHELFMNLLNNRKTVRKSYRTKYLEEVERNNDLTIKLNELETIIKNTL